MKSLWLSNLLIWLCVVGSIALIFIWLLSFIQFLVRLCSGGEMPLVLFLISLGFCLLPVLLILWFRPALTRWSERNISTDISLSALKINAVYLFIVTFMLYIIFDSGVIEPNPFWLGIQLLNEHIDLIGFKAEDTWCRIFLE